MGKQVLDMMEQWSEYQREKYYNQKEESKQNTWSVPGVSHGPVGLEQNMKAAKDWCDKSHTIESPLGLGKPLHINAKLLEDFKRGMMWSELGF